MRKLFSLNTLAQTIRQCARRFPITVVLITLLTIYWLAWAWTTGDLFTDKIDGTIQYYLAVGILLTIVLRLWGEEVTNRRKRLIVNIVAHISLLADSVYIYTIFDHFNMEAGLAHASAITALTLCMFILPFFREKDDISSWNFTLRLLLAGCTSWIIGGIMCGGIWLLTEAVEELFGIDLSSNWTDTWCILFLFTLPMLLYIGRIPAGEKKHDRTPHMSAFLHKSIRFLFLPLLGCYLAVLYGYLAKIILEWQLPDGWVSSLVSVLTFGSIAVVLGLYPLLFKGASKTDSRIIHFLPLLILPLLVLMTVGIARRLGDYGVTARRLYLLTLNIWFYLVCIGLLITKARRIWWIAASFATFFLLTSVLPVNITSFTGNWIYDRVETTIKSNYKGKLPMSEETYLNWIATLPSEEARLVNSRLRYLNYELSTKNASALVSDSIGWYKAEEFIKDTAKDTITGRGFFFYSNNIKEQEIKLDSNYAAMIVFTDRNTEVKRTKGDKQQVPIYKGKQPVDTLTISISDMRIWDALSNYTPQAIPCRKKGNIFILTAFTLQDYNENKGFSFRYSGYYLIKK